MSIARPLTDREKADHEEAIRFFNDRYLLYAAAILDRNAAHDAFLESPNPETKQRYCLYDKEVRLLRTSINSASSYFKRHALPLPKPPVTIPRYRKPRKVVPPSSYSVRPQFDPSSPTKYVARIVDCNGTVHTVGPFNTLIELASEHRHRVTVLVRNKHLTRDSPWARLLKLDKSKTALT